MRIMRMVRRKCWRRKMNRFMMDVMMDRFWMFTPERRQRADHRSWGRHGVDGDRSDGGLVGGDVGGARDPGCVGQVVGGYRGRGHVVEVVVDLVGHAGQGLDHNWLGGVEDSGDRGTQYGDRWRGATSWHDSFSHGVKVVSVVGEHFGRFGVDHLPHSERVQVSGRYGSVVAGMVDWGEWVGVIGWRCGWGWLMSGVGCGCGRVVHWRFIGFWRMICGFRWVVGRFWWMICGFMVFRFWRVVVGWRRGWLQGSKQCNRFVCMRRVVFWFWRFVVGLHCHGVMMMLMRWRMVAWFWRMISWLWRRSLVTCFHCH